MSPTNWQAQKIPGYAYSYEQSIHVHLTKKLLHLKYSKIVYNSFKYS